MNELNYPNYRKLLTDLSAKYEFSSFSKIKYSNEPITNKLLLRHDLDLSIEKAHEMAIIEHELGTMATYFIFLRSPFYNVFSGKECELIKEIVGLGHNIGLHFDFAKYENLSIPQISYQIQRESAFMQDFFQIELDGVSFHRPISLEFFKKLELKSFPHSYEPVFVENFHYLSDSRGYWRYGHPLNSDAYKNGGNLHILVHPIWWFEESTSELDAIQTFKSTKNAAIEHNLYMELKSFWENINQRRNE